MSFFNNVNLIKTDINNATYFNGYPITHFATDSDLQSYINMNFFDLGVEIAHDLNEYPTIFVLSLATYGHGLYGMGEGLYRVNCVPEYIDKNNVKIYFSEEFSGIPIITKISIREYNIKFSLETENLIILLK